MQDRITQLEKELEDMRLACAEYQKEIFQLREQVRDLEYVYDED